MVFLAPIRFSPFQPEHPRAPAIRLGKYGTYLFVLFCCQSVIRKTTLNQKISSKTSQNIEENYVLLLFMAEFQGNTQKMRPELGRIPINGTDIEQSVLFYWAVVWQADNSFLHIWHKFAVSPLHGFHTQYKFLKETTMHFSCFVSPTLFHVPSWDTFFQYFSIRQ